MNAVLLEDGAGDISVRHAPVALHYVDSAGPGMDELQGKPFSALRWPSSLACNSELINTSGPACVG